LPQQPQANDVIGNAILDAQARGVNAVPYVPPVSPASRQYATVSPSSPVPVERYPLQVMGEEIMIETPLIGRHQLRNVALAIATAEELARQGFPVTARTIETGVRNTRWPGRFQVVPASGSRPQFVFDAAHNPAGAWALRSTLSTLYEGKRLILVFGVMRDKAMGEIAEILFPIAERVILTQADNPRSATPEEILESTRVPGDNEQAPSLDAAIARAEALAGTDGVVIVTGSIYLVGEAMGRLGIKD